jgi:hypothetical protein
VGLLDQPIAFRPPADVRRQRQRAPAKRTALCRHLLAVFQLARGNDHISAALGQRLDDLIAQAARTTRDQRNLAGEVE